MIMKENNGISFLEFPLLSEFKEIFHGVFTRKGGFSTGRYESLNIGKGNGDSSDSVTRNRAAISISLNDAELFFVNQVHGTDIIRISDNDGSRSTVSGDALIADCDSKALVIQTADCQSVMLYDPVKKAIANIHAGWRGSIMNIVGLTVQAMIEEFSVDPKDLIAAIGPSLGPCCAEFINYRMEIPRAFWHYKNNNDFFNFWAMTRDQLEHAGVCKENISIGNVCTKCRTDIFYSYRKEGVTGRFASVIGLKPSAM